MKTLLLNSKKGQIANYAVVIIFLFGFGFITIFAAVFMAEFIDEFTAAGIYTGPAKVAGDQFFAVFGVLDYIIVLIMVALLIGVGITSFRLNTSPGFFIVTLIVAPFLGFVSYFFNFLFSQIVTQDVFNAVLSIFPRTIMVNTNLHWVALAAVIIGSITLFAKKETPGEFVG